jgi:hypothetical protein
VTCPSNPETNKTTEAWAQPGRPESIRSFALTLTATTLAVGSCGFLVVWQREGIPTAVVFWAGVVIAMGWAWRLR